VTAIQLAHALGNKVLATAGSDEKCRACVELGAARAINYRTEDFVAEAKEYTGDRGVDVILDMVAGDYVPREMQCLADDGRLVIIALLGGAKANVDLNAVLRRRLVITGSTLRPRRSSSRGRSPASCARWCGRWSRPAGSGRCCTGPIRWQRRPPRTR